MFRFANWIRVIHTLVAVCVLCSVSVGSVAAAPRPKDKVNAALARAYKAEQKRLTQQDRRLARANEHATKLDRVVAKLKAKGRDTSSLEQAVATFRSEIADARSAWQSARDTLAIHAGFDDQGAVTNADQARATLQSARDGMRRAHELGHQAYQHLRTAIAEYRKNHADMQEPLAPEEP